MIFSDRQIEKAKFYVKELFKNNFYIEIKAVKACRSNLQNRFYWQILTIIEDCTGQDKNELHEYFKLKFLKSNNVEVLNEKIVISQSTTELNTKEFAEYINKIIVFAAELGIEIENIN